MNSIDKKLVLGLTVITAAITVCYGWTEEKIIQVPGLDVKNTKKFIAGVAILGAAILIINEIKKTKQVV